jgi:hypothetical protein
VSTPSIQILGFADKSGTALGVSPPVQLPVPFTVNLRADNLNTLDPSTTFRVICKVLEGYDQNEKSKDADLVTSTFGSSPSSSPLSVLFPSISKPSGNHLRLEVLLVTLDGKQNVQQLCDTAEMRIVFVG